MVSVAIVPLLLVQVSVETLGELVVVVTVVVLLSIVLLLLLWLGDMVEQVEETALETEVTIKEVVDALEELVRLPDLAEQLLD